MKLYATGHYVGKFFAATHKPDRSTVHADDRQFRQM